VTPTLNSQDHKVTDTPEVVEAEIRSLRAYVPYERIETRKRFRALADILEDLLTRLQAAEARNAELVGVLEKIAEGSTPPQQNGHYMQPGTP
jgi:hypothetical protein